jgi:hypothetical protein
MTVEQAQRQYDAFKRQGRYPLRDMTEHKREREKRHR